MKRQNLSESAGIQSLEELIGDQRTPPNSRYHVLTDGQCDGKKAGTWDLGDPYFV